MKKFLSFIIAFLLVIISLLLLPLMTFAEEVDVGYVTNKTTIMYENNNAQAYVSLPHHTNVNQYLYNILIIQLNNQTIDSRYIYQLELSTEFAKLINIYSINIVGGNNNSVTCQAYGMSDSDIGYPKIWFKCPQNVSYITIGLNNDNPQTLTQPITTSTNFSWNYSKLRYYTEEDDIDLGPIINNAINNTNNIINNQNQNTDNLLESQKVCSENLINSKNIKEDGKYLSSDGSIQTGNTNGISDYIDIKDSELKLISGRSGQAYSCYYNSNKVLISCFLPTIDIEGNLSIPVNAHYLRVSFNKNQQLPIFNLKVCKNGNQAISDSINGLNDSLNDDNTDDATNEASDFFSSFNSNTFGLTSIITAPLNLIQSLLNLNSCTPLSIPLPYLNNKTLDLPCMYNIYQNTFGIVFTMYQTISYGIIAYWVCVRIFNLVKDFKNPEHDEIEVLDL